ncbi:MAG: c-type cytochrome [Candidatus Sulfotelmatobacter sp.]
MSTLISKSFSRFALFVSLTFVFQVLVFAQETQPAAPKAATPTYADVPAEAAKRPNPIKSSPESITRARKWWNLDCAMCHGKDGDGKGNIAADMKLKIVDFTDPNTLKDRTDGEIFYVIKNGHQDMPPEGDRIKAEDGWDLVDYVRSLSAKPK